MLTLTVLCQRWAHTGNTVVLDGIPVDSNRNCLEELKARVEYESFVVYRIMYGIGSVCESTTEEIIMSTL